MARHDSAPHRTTQSKQDDNTNSAHSSPPAPPACIPPSAFPVLFRACARTLWWPSTDERDGRSRPGWLAGRALLPLSCSRMGEGEWGCGCVVNKRVEQGETTRGGGSEEKKAEEEEGKPKRDGGREGGRGGKGGEIIIQMPRLFFRGVATRAPPQGRCRSAGKTPTADGTLLKWAGPRPHPHPPPPTHTRRAGGGGRGETQPSDSSSRL